jgi:hypothetical protein
MLEKRYVAGKWIYRAPGALAWSYSQTDAIEQAKQETRNALRTAPDTVGRPRYFPIAAA